MSPIVIIAWASLALASPVEDVDAEQELHRRVAASREWLVAVFPAESGTRSLREQMWGRRRRGGKGPAVSRKYVGTGFVISTTGEIVTSNEVIPPGAKEVGVRFCDGRTMKASVIARYERGNLALIAVEGESFKTAPLSTRDDVKIGELVFTLGNVLDSIGIDGRPAVSRGVIARAGRAEGEGTYRGWAYETDAAVNSGSYGGPLLDLDGEVIGIVDPGYSTQRWLGQVIPIQVFREVLVDLRKGWLPRHTVGLSAEAAPEGGIAVVEVEKGGPADRAGLRPGDRIIRAEREEITRPRDLDTIAARFPVRTPIVLQVLRGKEETRLMVRIGRKES
ncbi:MAG: trypsin-like peptidase domain-containing protein [Planctomycetota bacterium]|nr:trypsin-like peptidase domain-containing protein [Planctomycetota bacterium]